ncbi:hypothetical protein [Bdellovibrio sp. NC01]|uniref:hypothetical protein n=1 Tax=Bdellovibrio sp. NC01 TaxID=2220073 RepID=UPI0011571D4E|nr:hypothetical protein [Bdellovibrio sp. NC01]QDK38342.1 hypothetical protein DOE51_12505 [Bdellovibrio sp. NC01]
MKMKSCLILVLAVITAFSTAEARTKKRVLKMSQPQKGAIVKTVVSTPKKQPNVTPVLRSASVLAESLDEKAGAIINSMAMNSIQKWIHNVDETKLKAEYAEELMVHMTRMTALFSAHRKAGPFAKFSELEFQNLLVKSDYLLSLAVSRESLEYAQHRDLFARRFSTALAAYNAERLGFDQKMIRFNFASN